MLQATDDIERRLSEASLGNDSTSSVNVLSSEYDTLSQQVKAVILEDIYPISLFL